MITKRYAGILDTTLREGEQTPGVNFSVEQRVMIARSLSDLGVRMIETGHPSVSPDVLEGIRQIVRMKDQGMISSELIAHSRSMASDIDLAVSTGVDRVAIFYGVSGTHLSSKTHRTQEEALQIIGEGVERARSQGVKVRFTPEDASRTDWDYLTDVIRTAESAGADRIGIADTVGIMLPWRTRAMFRQLSRSFPGLEFDIHAHNDLGNAVGNSLAAVEGGATIVHATVNGLGERVGITPTQVIAVALKYHMSIEAADLTKLAGVSEMVERFSGIKLQPNYPVTGRYAFMHKSGVHVAGIMNNPSTYEFIDPSLFGRERDFTIDKYTGKHALASRLSSLGLKCSGNQLDILMERIKSSPEVSSFTDDAIMAMVSELQTVSVGDVSTQSRIT
ncbi:MAG: hypothetical protein AMDU1_APLC00004G0051 [Thermoplasmatales archaeon A-plasma]|jgi:2-isopropylmalate synthase|nr:MAG: hypothetical protein AMDU1_APLC00004G0051 [Thermoplasmatales archaeon A-plasma]